MCREKEAELRNARWELSSMKRLRDDQIADLERRCEKLTTQLEVRTPF